LNGDLFDVVSSFYRRVKLTSTRTASLTSRCIDTVWCLVHCSLFETIVFVVPLDPGASPFVVDVFVEVDYMVDEASGRNFSMKPVRDFGVANITLSCRSLFRMFFSSGGARLGY